MAKSQTQREYSENTKTLHDYLKQYVSALLLRMREELLKGMPVNPMLLLWPKRPVLGDDGSYIEKMVAMDLKEHDVQNLRDTVAGAILRTNALGYLLVTPIEKGILASLETPFGTDGWLIQKQRRGDITFWKEPKSERHTCLMLLQG